MASQYRYGDNDRSDNVEGRRRSVSDRYYAHNTKKGLVDRRRSFVAVKQNPVHRFLFGKQVEYTDKGEKTGEKAFTGHGIVDAALQHADAAFNKYKNASGGVKTAFGEEYLPEDGAVSAPVNTSGSVVPGGVGNVNDMPISNDEASKKRRRDRLQRRSLMALGEVKRLEVPKKGKSKLHAGRSKTNLSTRILRETFRQSDQRDTDQSANTDKPALRKGKWQANQQGTTTKSRGVSDGTGDSLASPLNSSYDIKISSVRRKIYEFTHNGGAGDMATTQMDNEFDLVKQSGTKSQLRAANPARPKGPSDANPIDRFVSVAPQPGNPIAVGRNAQSFVSPR